MNGLHRFRVIRKSVRLGMKVSHSSTFNEIQFSWKMTSKFYEKQNIVPFYPFIVSISTQVLSLNCLGEGDSGDNWEILCDGRYWMHDDPVQLWHADTNAFLAATGSLYGPPIFGQMEIVGSHISDNTCDWTATEGVLVPPAGTQSTRSVDERNEL